MLANLLDYTLFRVKAPGFRSTHNQRGVSRFKILSKHVIITGHFKACIGSLNDSNDAPRRNLDKKINTEGRLLVDLCKKLKMTNVCDWAQDGLWDKKAHMYYSYSKKYY